MHPENHFVKSTKNWFSHQCFLFKYESMEILFELTTKILLIFLQFQPKKFASSAKQKNCILKLLNYCRIKEMIFLIIVKLKKFC